MKSYITYVLIFNLIFPIHSERLTDKQVFEICKQQKQTRFLESLEALAKPFLRSSYNSDNPYRHTPAQVRTGSELCAQEQEIVTKRLQTNKKKLEEFLEINLNDNQVPRIAICTSGGGYRAMIATIGALIGLEEIKLIDSILYASTLSGSTWAMASWTSTNCKLDSLKNSLSNNISTNRKINRLGLIPPITELTQIKKVIKTLTTEYLFNQSLEAIDIWGALLANNLLFHLPNRQELRLSEQHNIIKNGNKIFPIYTAIEPQEENFTYQWYEFTPYEVGSYYLNCYVPTWAFGRQFKNGKSVPFATTAQHEFQPEFTLGYMLGIFGSAFEANIEEVIKIIKDGTTLNYIEQVAVNTLSTMLSPIEEKRLFPAKTFNFSHGIESSPTKTQQHTVLIDAGLACNLPMPPVLKPERKVDIIFVLDFSSDLVNAPELARSEQYARAHNLKFPKIDYKGIEKNSLSVFMDTNDKSVPVVVYMPMIKDEKLNYNQNSILKNFDPLTCINETFCSTYNLAYLKDEFNQLCEFTKFNVVQNKENIKQLIKNVINYKIV